MTIHTFTRTRPLLLAVALMGLIALTLTAGCPGSGPSAVQDPHAMADGQNAADVPGENAQAGDATELTVWVPCAYASAMPEIVPLFEEQHPGVKISTRVENIAVMPPRILEGETPDVLMSIGDVEVKPLTEADLVDYNQTFCFVEIYLVTKKGNPRGIESLSDLATDRVESVGVGTEDISVGYYAREMLRSAGIWEQVEGKIVEADMPVTLLRSTVEERVDAALAYAACVRAEKGEAVQKLGAHLQCIEEGVEDFCPTIACPAVSIKGCPNPELAKQFIDFLTTDEIQQIISDYGFLTLSEPKCF